MQLRHDLKQAFRPITGECELEFPTLTQEFVAEPLTFRSEGGMLRGNLGGYAELSIAWMTADKEHALRVRLAQRTQDSSIEMDIEAIRVEDETPAAILRELMVRWGKRYKIVGDSGLMLCRPSRVKSPQDLLELVDLLTDPVRSHPVAVVTEGFEDERYSVDPEVLGEALTGLAHVVACPQAHTRALRDSLGGQAFAVFNGALRVYHPGFQVDYTASVYTSDPLVKLEDVERRLAAGTLLPYVRHLALEQLPRTEAGPSERFREVRKAISTAKWVDDEVVARDFDLRQATLAYRDATEEVQRLQSKIERQERELATLRRELSVAQGEEVPAGSSEPQRRPLDEVLVEALEGIEGVTVWDTARAAAAAVSPERYVLTTVTRALEAIAQYATKLRESDDFHLGENPYYFFQTRGLDFKASESPTTMGLHGAARSHQGPHGPRTVETHVTLNPGGPRCVQVYFEADPDHRCVDVVYCGAHLPTATMTHNN